MLYSVMHDLKQQKVDMLIHAGDICGHVIGPYERPGSEYDQSCQRASLLTHWNAYAEYLGIPVVMVPGNHDFCFTNRREWDYKPQSPDCYEPGWIPPEIKTALHRNITVLNNSSTTILGKRIWGSAWSRCFHFWGFNFSAIPIKYAEEANKMWGGIPDDADIVITHGPPYGIGDPGHDGLPCGDKILLERLDAHDCSLVVSGHLHSGYGVRGRYVNAAMCDERQRLVRDPILFTLLS